MLENLLQAQILGFVIDFISVCRLNFPLICRYLSHRNLSNGCNSESVKTRLITKLPRFLPNKFYSIE